MKGSVLEKLTYAAVVASGGKVGACS